MGVGHVTVPISLPLTVPRQVREGTHFLHVPFPPMNRLTPSTEFFPGDSGIRVPHFASLSYPGRFQDTCRESHT